MFNTNLTISNLGDHFVPGDLKDDVGIFKLHDFSSDLKNIIQGAVAICAYSDDYEHEWYALIQNTYQKSFNDLHKNPGVRTEEFLLSLVKKHWNIVAYNDEYHDYNVRAEKRYLVSVYKRTAIPIELISAKSNEWYADVAYDFLKGTAFSSNPEQALSDLVKKWYGDGLDKETMSVATKSIYTFLASTSMRQYRSIEKRPADVEEVKLLDDYTLSYYITKASIIKERALLKEGILSSIEDDPKAPYGAGPARSKFISVISKRGHVSDNDEQQFTKAWEDSYSHDMSHPYDTVNSIKALYRIANDCMLFNPAFVAADTTALDCYAFMTGVLNDVKKSSNGRADSSEIAQNHLNRYFSLLSKRVGRHHGDLLKVLNNFVECLYNDAGGNQSTFNSDVGVDAH